MWPSSGSVLLQDEVLQLVRGAQQEGGGLPVAGDELPHRRDLRGTELGRCPAPTPPLAVAVGARGGAVWGHGLHTQICGAFGGGRGGGSENRERERERERVLQKITI